MQVAQHALTLIELRQVTGLQRDARVSLVRLHCQLPPYCLHSYVLPYGLELLTRLRIVYLLHSQQLSAYRLHRYGRGTTACCGPA